MKAIILSSFFMTVLLNSFWSFGQKYKHKNENLHFDSCKSMSYMYHIATKGFDTLEGQSIKYVLYKKNNHSNAVDSGKVRFHDYDTNRQRIQFFLKNINTDYDIDLYISEIHYKISDVEIGKLNLPHKKHICSVIGLKVDGQYREGGGAIILFKK